MRSFVVASLTVLIALCAVSASASGWRDLRIDVSRFEDSVQQMRDELPYHHALRFVLTLKDLKARFSPAEYRQRLNGLTYKEIVKLGSPNVMAEFLAHYGGGGVGAIGTSCPCEGGAAAPAFSGGSWSGSTVGAGVTWGAQ